MKVLIIGSGGREHALAWKIAQSPLLTKLYCAPGNAGISKTAECVSIPSEDIAALLSFAQKEKIDLTVVGPEAPLVAGIVDEFEKNGLKIFGPNKAAALLEGSKAYSKDQMSKFGIPTADYEVFSHINEAKHYVIEAEMPLVIKADGLAAGKGVVICQTSQEAVSTLSKMMEEKAFGDAGHRVVVEKVVEGQELSVLAFSDGKKIIPLASSQDHKRAYDNDRGPNTGGMGAYSPCPIVADDKMRDIVDLTIRPMIEGLANEGIVYKGVIYAGLMMTKEGPMVLEYNCRFGDPETEVILPRMKSDLLSVLMQIAGGHLEMDHLEWHDKACITVVMASGGYPGFYHKDFPIHGLDSASRSEDVVVFHAGTANNPKGEVVTAGGRVLAVTALGENLRAAYDKAYAATSQIHFEGGFFRRDIGRRAMEVLK